MQLTHRQLEIFQSLMQTMSVTETANLLFSSQPTISRELKTLEMTLGFPLFRRENRKLEATPQAIALNVIVQRSFVSVREIGRAADAIRGDRLQRLSLACLPAFAHALVPDVVNRFHARLPGTAIKVHSLEETALTRDLLSKLFDVAIVEGSFEGDADGVQQIYVGDLLCILPRDHPLAPHERLSAKDFNGHDFIYYSEEDSYRRKIDMQFEAVQSSRHLLIETTTATSIGRLVNAGLGVSIVNPLTALAFESDEVVVRALDEPIPYYLRVWQPEVSRRSKPGALFVEAIEETAAEVVKGLLERNLCKNS